MKLLAVSDRTDPVLYGRGLEAHAGGVEAVISCGDLPFEYLEYLATFLNVPVFYVRGNRDPGEESGKRPGGCIPLDGRVEEVGGVSIAGLSGCNWYSGGPNQYTERQMSRRARSLARKISWRSLRGGHTPRVFASHAPPLGLGDREDVAHRGYRAFLPLIDRYEPGFWLHGHVHLYKPERGRRFYRGDTRVLNVYRHQILEV